MKARALFWILTAGVIWSGTAAATPTCVAPARLVQWPTASNAVWEMCVLRPADSSGTNGSGLELRDVYYHGNLVLKRAHAPILNVLYLPSGCGCYRDWSDQEVQFQANNVIAPGYAEPTTPPLTVCDTGGAGGDVGSFYGVAAEKLSDRLILTTQFEAGWYRYTMKWKFFADGRIVPWFGFGAVNASCINFGHTHHVYWRLDFDVDDSNANVIEQGPPADKPVGSFRGPKQLTEFKRTVDQSQTWIVRDNESGRGYRIVPGKTSKPDAFAVSDFWFLKYHSNEIDDSGQSGPPCSIKFNNYLNGESINGTDVVVWVRGGHFHAGGDLDDCGASEITLEPVGNWVR